MGRIIRTAGIACAIAAIALAAATSAVAGDYVDEKDEDTKVEQPAPKETPRYECMTSLEPSAKSKDTYDEYRHCIASPRHFPTYKGWHAYVDHHCDFAPFNADMACTEQYVMHDAWAWHKGGWSAAQIGEGTRVYIHPFGSSTEWRWIYTADAGWMAIDVDQLVLRWSVPTGMTAMH